MAPVVLTADEQMAAMEAGSSELKYQLAKEGVTVATQAKLFHCGALTLAKFAAFFKDKEEVRAVAKDDLGLDPSAGLGPRAEVAGLIVSWESANVRTQEVSKHMGELDARKQTKPLLGSEYLVMRNAFQTKFYKLEDSECPARVYLEKRIAEMEAGEMRAESLKTVLNREEDGDESLIPSWDKAGNLNLKRASSDIEEPSNPEELRRRLQIMVNGLIFISLQHSNRAELQGIRPEYANTYAGYLLGEHCWMLIARDSEGHTIASPNWKLVLRYEMAIRKKAYNLMNDDGIPFIQAMDTACKDSLTKDRAFITPLAISAAAGSKGVEIGTSSLKRAADFDRGSESAEGGIRPRGGKKGKGKGKGRGKGKGGKAAGKGPQIPSGCARSTPDGHLICYGYNDPATRCRNPRCPFAHVCGICFQKHPLYACQGRAKFAEGNKPPADTQGGRTQ
jgi:hypothetical protein